MKIDIIAVLFVTLSILLFTIIIFVEYNKRQCEDKGGVFVDGYFESICIDKKVVLE